MIERINGAAFHFLKLLMGLREIELCVRMGEEWFRKKYSRLELGGGRASSVSMPLRIVTKSKVGDKGGWGAGLRMDSQIY